MKMLPVLGSLRAAQRLREAGEMSMVLNVPIDLMRLHEAQAVANHCCDIDGLMERGGLRARDIAAILEGVQKVKDDDVANHRTIARHIVAWRKANVK